MKIKYEAVFGDQALFNSAPDDAEAVGGGKPLQDALVFYEFSDGEFQYKYEAEIDDWMVSTCNHPQSVIKAMRRIIKDPKRWTWEDKKAGRLPEVGAKCNHCHSVDERTVLSVTDKYVGIECDNSDINPYFVTHAEFIQYYIPIETPAEKAQREEDEFVEELASGVARYDSFINGARAAYRKLKGGE